MHFLGQCQILVLLSKDVLAENCILATRSGFCKSVSKRHLTSLEKSQANFKSSNISPCTQWVSKRC